MAEAKHSNLRVENQVSRRNLLTAAPIGALAAALTAGSVSAAVQALGIDETPVRAAFKRWWAYYRELNDLDATRDMTEDEYNAACARLNDYEDAVVEHAAQDSTDLLMQLLAFTANGQDLSAYEMPMAQRFLKDVRERVGVAA